MATVQKLPSGRYRIRVTYKVGNRFRQKSFTGDTKKEVQRRAAAFVPPKTTGTIGQMLDQYINAKKAVLSPSTIRGYINLAHHIKTQYAAFCALTEASQAQAQALVDQMPSPKTARNTIGLISAAVRFFGGTFPRVQYPRWELRTDFIPSEDDMQKIVQAVVGTNMEIPVALGIMGLRRSEIVALSLSDLDGDLLHIHSALVYGIDGKAHRKTTKTEGSDRTIAIPTALAEKVRRQGYFTDISANTITTSFARTVKRLGIKMRFHDLRHYFVSYCHNVLRLSDAQIMRLGGWTTDGIMKRHYRQSMHDEETARLVADAFSATISATK